MDTGSPSSDQADVILDPIVHKAKPKLEEAVSRDATPTSSGPSSRSPKVLGFDLNMDLDENGEIPPGTDEATAKEEEEQELDGPPNAKEPTKDSDVDSENVLGGTLHLQGSEVRPSVHPDEDDYDCEDEDG